MPVNGGIYEVVSGQVLGNKPKDGSQMVPWFLLTIP